MNYALTVCKACTSNKCLILCLKDLVCDKVYNKTDYCKYKWFQMVCCKRQMETPLISSKSGCDVKTKVYFESLDVIDP